MTHTESNTIYKMVQIVTCMWVVTPCRMYCCTFLDSYVFLLTLILPWTWSQYGSSEWKQ